MQELLKFRGVRGDHMAISQSSVSGIDMQEPEVSVYALRKLALTCCHNMPHTIKIATV